jgi:hypothetical protein
MDNFKFGENYILEKRRIIKEKWKEVGLLCGLTEEKELSVLNGLEIALNYCHDHNNITHEKLKYLSFPMLRRVLSVVELNDLVIVGIIEELNDKLNTGIIDDIIDNISGGVDVEAEFLQQFSDEIIDNYFKK